MSQELGRHVRDKVCQQTRVQTEIVEERTLDPEILLALSLRSTVTSLEVPVISTIPPNLVTSSIVTAIASTSTMSDIIIQPSISSVRAEASLTLLIEEADSEAIIETGDEKVLMEVEQVNDNESGSLWGCKQCDFR